MKFTNELNLKNKIERTNKGITLIALIITIIVMLIIVAVTISMVINGGLFSYGGKALGETENAINDEQVLADGKIQIDGKWYDSIDEYLDKGKIKITYEYVTTEDKTVNLQFEIVGMQTFEEYAEEYMENVSTKELETLIMLFIGYEGSFEEYLIENEMTRDDFENRIKEQTGLEYKEGLKK